MYNIPFGRPIIEEEEKNAVMEVLNNPILVHGPKTKSFEDDFAKFTNSPYAIAISSCTAGIAILYYLKRLSLFTWLNVYPSVYLNQFPSKNVLQILLLRLSGFPLSIRLFLFLKRQEIIFK